jgi:hypothetical protein
MASATDMLDLIDKSSAQQSQRLQREVTNFQDSLDRAIASQLTIDSQTSLQQALALNPALLSQEVEIENPTMMESGAAP